MNNGGLVRLHRLLPGDALDRRRLEELFAWCAQRFNEIGHRSIANDQIGRDRFLGPSFEEMWYATEKDLNFGIPGNPQLVSGTTVPVRNDDSYIYGELSYSIEAEAQVDDGCLKLVAWPVFASQALWSGECYMIQGDEKGYNGTVPIGPFIKLIPGDTYNTNDRVTLSGTCNFVAANGRMLSGVLVQGVGDWRILGAQMVIKVRAR